MKPEGPQPPAMDELLPELPLDPTMTPTAEKLRSVFPDPHSGHSGELLSEYSDMDIRTSKVTPQSAHRKSYRGMTILL